MAYIFFGLWNVGVIIRFCAGRWMNWNKRSMYHPRYLGDASSCPPTWKGVSKFWGSNFLLGKRIFYAHPYFLGCVFVGGDSLQIVPFLATIWEKIFWYFFAAFYANPSIGFPRDWYILSIFWIFSTNRLFNSWGSYCNTKRPGLDRRLRTGLLGNSRAPKELLERSGQSVAAVLSQLPLLCSLWWKTKSSETGWRKSSWTGFLTTETPTRNTRRRVVHSQGWFEALGGWSMCHRGWYL